MSCDLYASRQDSRVAESQVKEPEAATAKAPAVEAVIEVVRRDSRDAARQYLDESSVPHGGE
jgi:hypothetical protein